MPKVLPGLLAHRRRAPSSMGDIPKQRGEGGVYVTPGSCILLRVSHKLAGSLPRSAQAAGEQGGRAR